MRRKGELIQKEKEFETRLDDMKKEVNDKLPQIDFDAFRKDYVVNNGFAKTTGTSTIYNVTLNPAPTSYVDGFNITIIPHTDCGDNPKLNVNGLGVTTILKQDGTDIKAGEIKANKPLSLVRVGSNFFIKSSGSGSPIKSIQRGEFSPDSKEGYITLNQAVNKSKAIIIANKLNFDSDPKTSCLRYYMNSNKDFFYSTGNDFSKHRISWEVIEFNSNIKIIEKNIDFNIPSSYYKTFTVDLQEINNIDSTICLYNRNCTPPIYDNQRWVADIKYNIFKKPTTLNALKIEMYNLSYIEANGSLGFYFIEF